MDLPRKRLERNEACVPQTHSLDNGENLQLPESTTFRERPKCVDLRSSAIFSIVWVNSYYSRMAITYQFWVGNLIGGARDIADEEAQKRRWIALDARAWERPAELLCVLLDDMNLELFIEEHGSRFSEEQLRTARDLSQAIRDFDCGPDGWRDPNDVLQDPAWEAVRGKARAFVSAFERDLG